MRCEYCQRNGAAGTQCQGCGARVPVATVRLTEDAPLEERLSDVLLPHPMPVVVPTWLLAPTIAVVLSAFVSGFMLVHRLAFVQEQLAVTVEQSAALKHDLNQRDEQLRQHVDMLYAKSIVLEKRIQWVKDR